MNKLKAVTLMAFCVSSFSVLSSSNMWINKNIAQNTDPAHPNSVTILVDNEYGDTNRKAYLCRENDRSDGLTNIGKAIAIKGQPLSKSVCYIPWKGKEYKRTENFDLLKIHGGNPFYPGFRWVYKGQSSDLRFGRHASIDIHLDSYAFPFEWAAGGGAPIYACLDQRTGTLGKLLYPSNEVMIATCFVPMGGLEHQVRWPYFSILTR